MDGGPDPSAAQQHAPQCYSDLDCGVLGRCREERCAPWAVVQPSRFHETIILTDPQTSAERVRMYAPNPHEIPHASRPMHGLTAGDARLADQIRQSFGMSEYLMPGFTEQLFPQGTRGYMRNPGYPGLQQRRLWTPPKAAPSPFPPGHVPNPQVTAYNPPPALPPGHKPGRALRQALRGQGALPPGFAGQSRAAMTTRRGNPEHNP